MKFAFFNLLARENCSGSQPQSVGKTMFYRKVSHSLRSCDTLRLFLFYLKLNFSLTDEFMIGKWARFRER